MQILKNRLIVRYCKLRSNAHAVFSGGKRTS